MTLRQKVSLTLLIIATAVVGMAAFAQTIAWAPPAPETTSATYYGSSLAGSLTASGERFDPNDLTAAHPSLPFGTRLTVCKNACTTVRVNDRPDAYTALDLSEAAADEIGLKSEGRAPVEIKDSETPEEPKPQITELPDTGGAW